MDGVRPPGPDYDITIGGLQDWDQLTGQGLDVIVDPFLLRAGQFFLEGKGSGPNRWEVIATDLGALVSFFDLVVLRDRLPAFNYPDTFDTLENEYRDRLGDVLNTEGDKTLVHVDVEHHMYREAKEAALDQLGRRMQEGPFVPQATADALLSALEAVQYEWQPRLEGLESRLPDARNQQLARFILGQLVFAGYAQQTGAPHVLAPQRSRFLASIGLRTDLPAVHAQTAAAEQALYKELSERCRNAGAGWRDDELPWTPSFLPFLLKQINPQKDGPDVLLNRAKELRGSKAVKRYRELRTNLESEDAARSAKAHRDLAKAADKIADELDSGREDLELTRHIVVEILPKAFGAAVGAGGGFVVAGPLGVVGGGVLGAVGVDPLNKVNERLWGWVIDRLPFRSARKLLTQSVRAEIELRERLGSDLEAVWTRARA